MKKKHFIITIIAVLLGTIIIVILMQKQASAPHNSAKSPKTSSTDTTTTPAEQTTTPASFNKQKYSLSDPASPWLVVNKQRPLNPKTFVPTDLVVPAIPLRSNITSTEKYVRSDTAKALEQMIAAAKSEGLNFNLQSGYRSYSFQVSLYDRYVQQQGKATADTQSARPGYSEHQTGMAADLGSVSHPSCDVEACFGETAEGKWLAANAHTYGFVIRYQQGKDGTTGYAYEPWHVRYVGTELANEIFMQGNPPLETFFGLGDAPSY